MASSGGRASTCEGGVKMQSSRGLRLERAWLVWVGGFPRVEAGIKYREGVASFRGGVASSGGRGFHVSRRG